jgi:hypothetical protein
MPKLQKGFSAATFGALSERTLVVPCLIVPFAKSKKLVKTKLMASSALGLMRLPVRVSQWISRGQGTATTGETEALALIDTTARFVTVIPLKKRQVQTFLQPFLDQVVFRHGPPGVIHCDEAPEFMSDLMDALLKITETTMTTTLGHNARSCNGIIKIF